MHKSFSITDALQYYVRQPILLQIESWFYSPQQNPLFEIQVVNKLHFLW